MDTLRLRKAECELRLAAQSLWTYRQKDQPHPEVSELLDGSQDALSDLIDHLSSVAKMLEGKDPV